MSVCSHKYNEAWPTLSVKQNTHMLNSTFTVIILSCTNVTRVWYQGASYMEKITVVGIPCLLSSQTQYNTVVIVYVALHTPRL